MPEGRSNVLPSTPLCLSPVVLVSWIFGHVVAGALVSQSGLLATLYGGIAIVVCSGLVFFGRERWCGVAAIGYISLCDVVWRLSGAALPWLGGAYFLAILSVCLIVRSRSLSLNLAPYIYFVIVILGILIALSHSEINNPRFLESLRFNSVGPLSLCLCVAAFGGQRLRVGDLQPILVSLLGPGIMVATAALISTVTAPELVFTSESNFETSGGFGPNQVSASMGLAALTAFLLFLLGHRSWGASTVLLVLFFALMMQCALTFSRGGVLMTLLAVGVSVGLVAAYPVYLARVLFVACVGGALAVIVLVPFLVAFTEGMIVERYRETTPSKRVEIMIGEVQMFYERPLLGVGVGASRYLGEKSGIHEMNHTEYVRVIIEHGILGSVAFVVLLGQSLLRGLLSGHVIVRTALLSMAVWWLLFYAIYGYRISVPGFLVALAFVRFERAPGGGSSEVGVSEASSKVSRFGNFA